LLPLFLPSCAPACLLGFVLCGDIDGLFASLRQEELELHLLQKRGKEMVADDSSRPRYKLLVVVGA